MGIIEMLMQFYYGYGVECGKILGDLGMHRVGTENLFVYGAACGQSLGYLRTAMMGY